MRKRLQAVRRRLRRESTRHEIRLWKHLRDRQLDGMKFRRQYEIGPYIVDFCCVENRLIIELDGGGHDAPYQERLDQQRDGYLRERGFTVIRIWNSELDMNCEGVLEHIQRASGNTPLTPTLSPQKGERE